MTLLLRRLGGACAARPWRVVAGWLVLAVTAGTCALTLGGPFSQQHTLPGTEVDQADARLTAHFPQAANDSAEVLLHGAPGAVRAAVPVVRRAVAALPRVSGPPAAPRWSADRRTALLEVSYDTPRFTLGSPALSALRRAAATGGVESHVTGSLAVDLTSPDTGVAEKVGVGLAFVVLLVAFGSVFAAMMPIATAGLAIVIGLSLVRLLANVYAVDGSAPALASMLGLGAGVDYALFIVTRHREGMRTGLAPREAARAATASAGTSVLWAGVTVVAAICGLAFAGIPMVTSLGFASAIVVAVSVLAALTLLPALLALTGARIDRLHVPLPHLRHERVGHHPALTDPGSTPAGGWARWARAIERHPVRYVVGSVALLGLLAVPVGTMRLGMPDGSAAAPGTDARRTFELMAAAYGPGSNGVLRLVVALPGAAAGRRDDAGTVTGRLAAAVRTDPDVASVGPMQPSPDGTTALLTVVPRTGPQDAATAELVARLRGQVLPPVTRATGSRVWVGGLPAGRYDVGQRVLDRLPWFVGAVLALSFLLLMVVFRSLLVPLKAVLLNLLSIAAALGVVVAIFTWGWLRQVVGVAEPVPLVDVIPMMMFAIVFGLSMDYEVFLLSRVREEWALDGDGRGSVVRGLTSTARVISAAAAIMVSVFCAFTLSSDVVVKMMGLGLAVAVFLDATVIRLVLVPATMALLGDLNWWLPRRLDRWLPHVDVNASVPVTPLPAETADPVAVR